MLVPIGSQLFAAAIRPRGTSALALPKGHPEPGESDVVAAVREVREETGLSGRAVADLGQIDYWFYSRAERARVHKTVAFFLLAYRRGNWREHDAEVERVRLIPIHDLAGALTYRGEREIALRAASALGPARAADRTGDVGGDVPPVADAR